MAKIGDFLLGGLQLLAGIFLLATGVGGGLGFKLIVSGALSLISQAIGGKGRSGLDNDPRYGFDNAQNVTIEGMPYLILYGEEEVAPPVISAIVKPEGSKQVLYMLLMCGEGEIDAITNIKLNGVPLSSFPDSLRMVKRGTPGQSADWVAGGNDSGEGGDVVVGGFGQVGQPYGAGTRITDQGPGAGEHIHEMHAEADELWVTLRWQGGIYHLNNDGSTKSSEWFGTLLVKAYGDPDSKYVEYLIPKDSAGNRTLGEFYAGTYGAWATGANTRSDLRRTMVIVFPARGRYTVKVQGFSDDDENDIRVPTVTLITEVSNEKRKYPNVALLAIKCPATEQLQGTIPVVTCRIRGRRLYDFRTGLKAWSRNPALVVYDLLTNARYGLGGWLTSADLDVGVGGTFRAFADRCEEQVTPPGRDAEDRYQLDLVMSTRAPAREWLEMILSTCRASLFQSQGLIKIREDRDGASVRSFDARRSSVRTTRHNILAPRGVSSLVIRHLADAERPTVVRVKHIDRDRDFRPATTTVQDWRLNVGAIVGGTVAVGAQLKGATSGAVGYLSATARNGDPFLSYVQEAGATAFVTGEVLSLGAGASPSTCSSTSDPYRATPEKPLEVQLVGITRKTQAQREARYMLTGALRRPLFASWGIFWGDVDLEPCDVVDVSSDVLGYASKLFQVLEVAYGQDGTGRVQAREYDEDCFAIVDRKPEKVAVPVGGSTPPFGSTPPGSNPADAPPAGNTTTPPFGSGPAPAPGPPVIKADPTGSAFFGTGAKTTTSVATGSAASPVATILSSLKGGTSGWLSAIGLLGKKK